MKEPTKAPSFIKSYAALRGEFGQVFERALEQCDGADRKIINRMADDMELLSPSHKNRSGIGRKTALEILAAIGMMLDERANYGTHRKNQTTD